MMTPQPAIAAERYTYLVVSKPYSITRIASLETELNKRAAEGWELCHSGGSNYRRQFPTRRVCKVLGLYPKSGVGASPKA